jgi:hypothetical protein
MILDNEPMFDNCLIKTSKRPVEPAAVQETEDIGTLEKDDVLEEMSVENIVAPEPAAIITGSLSTMNDPLPQIETTDDLVVAEAGGGEETAIELEFEDLTGDIEENPNELKEINSLELSAGNTLETIQLKKPNQVYFEIYKAARNKAKAAKKNALLAYLEAKNIKKTYMLDNLNDSDSDIDAEIDEVSESELDGL